FDSDLNRLVSLMDLDVTPFLPALIPPILRAARGERPREDENVSLCACGTEGRMEAAQRVLLGLAEGLGEWLGPYANEMMNLAVQTIITYR
ncbi:hypothetical protein PENTCL1PPCAC_2794, partial [Pristionchus entomophagus]